MSNRAKPKNVNTLFIELLRGDRLLVELDESRAALKAFKRWRHLNTRRRNSYYDSGAQLFVFKAHGKDIIAKLRKAGFHIVEGIPT